MVETRQGVIDLTEKYYAEGVEIRHHLHENPEISEHESGTAQYVLEQLQKHGIEACEIIEHGILGMIHGGKPGKTVLLRADIDALELTERADVPCCSKKPGVMHACGHDGHTAGLLIAAFALNEMRAEITGTIKLMFQPAEETVGGADRMIRAGILENPRVDAAFGCHLWGNLPEGKVGFKDGPMMASPDEFRVTLKGRGGHGATPHLTIDPIVMAAETVLQFQTIVSRRVNPITPAVVTVGMIRGGDVHNIIPEEVQLIGTIRTFDKELRDFIPAEMERILKGIALSSGGSYCFESIKRFPPLINNREMNALARTAAAKIIGAKNVLDLEEPNMGGEDFAYLCEKVPGSFCFVGIAKDPAKPVIHHNPYFAWDDKVLKVSSACLMQSALDFLDQRN